MEKGSQISEKKDNFDLKRSKSGLGLFASDFLKPGDFVIEYTGKLLFGKESEGRYNKYLFEVNSELTIDGSSRKNLARYVNHSCRPNCEVRIYAKRVRIYAIRKIKPGEELTYDYGKEYFDEYIKPIGCKCKSCLKKIAKNPKERELRKNFLPVEENLEKNEYSFFQTLKPAY